MGLIYRLTFPNGKAYIGLTANEDMTPRMAQHKYKSQRANYPIYHAWRKHGAPLLDIISAWPADQLQQAEIDAIQLHNTLIPHGYNLLIGGQVSPSTNPSVAKKISEATFRRYLDPAQRMDASHRAQNRSPATRQKLSEALTGKTLSEATKQKIREHNTGQKHSAEAKQKMSSSHTGKKYSEETIQRMRVAAKLRMQNPEAKAQLKAASLAGGQAQKQKAMK
jgi:group I intron endonuclease